MNNIKKQCDGSKIHVENKENNRDITYFNLNLSISPMIKKIEDSSRESIIIEKTYGDIAINYDMEKKIYKVIEMLLQHALKRLRESHQKNKIINIITEQEEFDTICKIQYNLKEKDNVDISRMGIINEYVKQCKNTTIIHEIENLNGNIFKIIISKNKGIA